MATYDYLKSKNGHKIQVESAKRDGAGKNIENNYAKQNGYYAQLTSGNADQLNSTIFVTDQVPYLFRTSGGDADIGNREYDKIIGGSLVVNQLVQNGNFDTTTKWGSTRGTISASNNICTYTITQVGNSGDANRIDTTLVAIPAGRIVYFEFSFYTTHAGSGEVNIFNSTYYPTFTAVVNYSSGWNTIRFVKKLSSSYGDSVYLRIGFNATNGGYSVGDTVQWKNVMVFDLTQMFGSTIADYIYSLEQNQTGAGVSWFRQYFQELYYPYNTGAIKNVQLISHDMVGFNQWDEEWEVGGIDNSTGAYETNGDFIRSKNYCRCLPNTVYYGYTVSEAIRVFFYDSNKNYISNVSIAAQNSPVDKTFTTPSNACWFRLKQYNNTTHTYNNDICINLSWSGWRNGQYEPYKKNSYPLDTTIELRGIPKLDADNHLYFDGDEYTYDGKVVRKYGSYTFTGNETFGGGSSDGIFVLGTIVNLVKKPVDNNTVANITCNALTKSSANGCYYGNLKIAVTDSGAVYLLNTNYANDMAGFKLWITGKTFNYELATPTEETAEPYQEIQIVDDFGTEEYVVPTQDGWQIPVGHDTKYPANLRDKLQRLPDMPSVSQNVTETYVVNYNGTTKKCTFVAIDTWLSSNGYVKQVDLSDQITDAAGLTYLKKLVYKSGNIVTLTIRIKNGTGSSIAANTPLFTFASGLFNPSIGQESVCVLDSQQAVCSIENVGDFRLKTSFNNNSNLFVTMTYAVA